MKNRSTKKGFTLVELVIVIAVIAILSAVLIPTFSNVIENANKSKAMSEANNAYKAYIANPDNVQTLDSLNLCIKSGTYYYHVENGQFKTEEEDCNGTHTAGVAYKQAEVKDGELEVKLD